MVVWMMGKVGRGQLSASIRRERSAEIYMDNGPWRAGSRWGAAAWEQGAIGRGADLSDNEWVASAKSAPTLSRTRPRSGTGCSATADGGARGQNARRLGARIEPSTMNTGEKRGGREQIHVT
jgi:hypothetical protein